MGISDLLTGNGPESMTYLQAMALSRGGQLGEAGGLSGLNGNQ